MPTASSNDKNLPPNPLHVLTINPRDFLINWTHLVNLAQDFYGRVLSDRPPAAEESVEIHFYTGDTALFHKDLFLDALVKGFGRREEGGEPALIGETVK